MPGVDERIRRALAEAAAPADPTGVFERVLERKIRRRIVRKLEFTALGVVVIAGTIGGSLGLLGLFRFGPGTQPSEEGTRNGQIAFATGDGSPAIDAVDVKGRRTSLVTGSTAGVSWSPDGTMFAYAVGTPDAHGEIDIANADGSGRRVLTTYGDPRGPAWSPGGTELVFSTRSGDLYTVSLDGTGLTRITRSTGFCHDSSPAWSPAGDRIAFIEDCPGERDPTLSVVPANGSGPPRVIEVGAASPAWSPDGSAIAFVTGAGGPITGISVVGVDATSALGVLVSCGPRACPRPDGLAWSPDGRSIAFIGTRGADATTTSVFVIKATGGALRQLPNTSGARCCLSWQRLPRRPQRPVRPITISPPPSSIGSHPSWRLCDASFVTADFDGDGRIDSASVGYARPRRGCPSDPPAKPEYGIGVRWGSGASGAWGLPECASSCVAYASADLDGNGTDEFALMVDDGAATQFIDILELPVSEAGPTLFEVAPPGTAGHPAHRPLRLATGGSVTHLDFVTCDAASGRELIATSAVLSSDQTTWSLHETVFDMELSARTSRVAIGSAFAVIDAAEAFFVVSDRDYSESADPGGRAPTVRGHPCFEAA